MISRREELIATLTSQYGPKQAPAIADAIISNEQPAQSYQGRLEAQAAAQQQAYAIWRGLAIESVYADCDGGAQLRAAVERTGTAWRELAEELLQVEASLTKIENERPLPETAQGVSERTARINRYVNRRAVLQSEVQAAEQAHQAAQQRFEGAVHTAIGERARVATRQPDAIRAQMHQAINLAELEARRWQQLQRQAERGALDLD